MAIETILNSILNEPYMKEMRQDIVDGIEQVYKDSTFDGNTNMEVIRARGSESSLVERLNKNDLTHESTSLQLGQTMSQSEFDSWVATIFDGSPSIFFDTLNSLITTYPNGAVGVALIRETNPAKIYAWNGTSWQSFGDYQGIEIKTSTVTDSKLGGALKEDVVTVNTDNPNTLDLTSGFDIRQSTAVNNYLYIQDLPIYRKGQIYLYVKNIGDVTVLLMKKNSDSSFTIVGKELIDLSETVGVTKALTNLFSDGSGTQYLAIVANNNFYTKSVDAAQLPFYFYNSTTTIADTSVGKVITTAKKTTLGQVSSFYWGVKSNIETLSNELGLDVLRNDIKNVGVPLVSRSLGALKLRETETNSTVYNKAYFSGRWFTKNVNGVDHMVTINQGAEIFAKFTGTSISGAFTYISGLVPFVAVSIDGGAYIRFGAGNTVSFATGLEDKEHYIHVICDGLREADDLWVNGLGLAFKNFVVDSGKTVSPIAPINKLIEWVGDSITAGVNVLGTGSSPTTNSASLSFPQIVSELLNTAQTRVGFGGTGVTKGGSGGVPSAINYIDYIKQDELSKTQAPDIIIINHGTNDASATSDVFKAAYRKLIVRLTIKNPGTPIICMRPFRGDHASDIQSVSSEFENCFYVDTSDWEITYTDGVHPNTNGHYVAGINLAIELKKIFGDQYFIA